MKGVFCGYYDEESDQSIPMEPTLDEAVLLFKTFRWENDREESAPKLLIFQNGDTDEASLSISKVDEDQWCISAAASTRRRFFGPFFKANRFKLFLNKTADEVEDLLRFFYQSSVIDVADLLKNDAE